MTNTLNGLHYKALSTAFSGGMSVIDGVTQVPRYGVTPTIASVETPELLITTGSGVLVLVRYTINAPNDAAAFERLRTGRLCRVLYPEQQLLQPGDPDATDPITRVDLVGIGAATNTGGFVVTRSDTAANVALAARKFEFAADDNVRAVSLSLSLRFGTSNVAQSLLNIAGRVYA